MAFDGPKCDLRAKDLAYEFERYGRLVRCDIPALKTAQSILPVLRSDERSKTSRSNRIGRERAALQGVKADRSRGASSRTASVSKVLNENTSFESNTQDAVSPEYRTESTYEQERLHELSNPLVDLSAFAFVEFRDPRDAEDAYYEMHGKPIDGRRINIQWAKRPPSSNWRYDDGRGGAPPRRDDDRRGGYGAPRRGRSPSPPPRRRSPSPRRSARRTPSPRRDTRDDRRSRSPVGRGGRSLTPHGNVSAAEADTIDDAVNENVRGEAGSDERDQ
ncbi:hypothetical protein QFC20_003091 [Naganishia adeliensis]|uniref:Uncharacterized protein n=1 Tax=Naganishia adeliensis TaxID=92952 RepID=A0ACC2WED8_9TREE|nr:hypothetical protein QFC20_003091 [Naganishia adeliensis]